MHSAIPFLIITKNPDLFATKQLVLEIEKAGHLVSTCSPKSLDMDAIKTAYIIINRNTGLDYSDADLDTLEKLTNPAQQLVTNSIECSRILRDKYQQALFLEGIIERDYLIDSYRLTEYEKATKEHPKQKAWIIKTNRGQQARGIITSIDLISDAKNLIHKGDVDYIIQPYFPLKREIRIIIIKSRNSCHQFVFEKTPKHKSQKEEFHILNFENAVSKMLVPDQVPNEAKDIAQKVVDSKLAFNFITIDILEDAHSSLKLLEINSCPGLKGALETIKNMPNTSNLTEIYISELISDYMTIV